AWPSACPTPLRPPRRPARTLSRAGHGAAFHQYGTPSGDRPEWTVKGGPWGNGVRDAFSGGLALHGKGLSTQVVNRPLLLGVAGFRQPSVDRDVGLETLAVPLLAGWRQVLTGGQDHAVSM